MVRLHLEAESTPLASDRLLGVGCVQLVVDLRVSSVHSSSVDSSHVAVDIDYRHLLDVLHA